MRGRSESSGLSPRTRRNPDEAPNAEVTERSISAHAEEPSRKTAPCLCRWVYLRARGGTRQTNRARQLETGLSPRTRRNPEKYLTDVEGVGSISAHAEEPPTVVGSLRSQGVYLRARGGTTWGTIVQRPLAGLSPRTRRNRIRWGQRETNRRSISAHAEEPDANK
ncbi:Hypothetical protein GbCGDNIH1_1701 [Granulibacter bethesdensis CGDNIH1]|uniref:Uncharacterized protein n=1 Tax=Granulibacter bethesdensis (strain ATCC BAA-1260 / CGDNIH1) TaxID=391165 RepID=Q0BRF3_GRABC|nr:Hypothetical protein GbCGDNIH1_1701 [Granulibacter bethesdensis CGDNIH1]APH65065.1 Hypothetical protein GbCGDNIH1I4_8027 [Granulibacter bethesdensis]